MDVEFIFQIILHVISLFFIIYIFQFNQGSVICIKRSILLSIFLSLIIFSSRIFINNILHLGIIVFLSLFFGLIVLNKKHILQVIYFTTFITTIIFYFYLFFRWIYNTKHMQLSAVVFAEYVLSLFFSAVFVIILVYLFKIKFFLPNHSIGKYILFFSISVLGLELMLFNFINTISIGYVFNLIVYLVIGMLFFSSNIIIQYLYNDFHQLTVVSQNNFLSKITDSYIQGIHQEQEKVFKIRHDIKNNLIILQQLINENQITKANQIIDEISSHLKYKKAVVYTGNIFIDAYLTYIINNSPMEIKLQCNDLKDLDYKPDILAIIINLVDNAVENANHDVSIQIKHEKSNSILIKVSNDCDNDPTKCLKKSKKKGDHGYGLRIVRDTVNQHQGTYLTSYQNGIFTTYVMLNIGENDEK